MTAIYDQLANQHRPTDPDQLAAEIRRLHDSGLTARDIAGALRVPPDLVINALGEDQHADIPELST